MSFAFMQFFIQFLLFQITSLLVFGETWQWKNGDMFYWVDKIHVYYH